MRLHSVRGMQLPDEFETVVDQPVFARLATVLSDVSPHVSVIWSEGLGDQISVATAEGRVKTEEHPPDNPVGLSVTELFRRRHLLGAQRPAHQVGGRRFWWLIDGLTRKHTGATSTRERRHHRLSSSLAVYPVITPQKRNV